MIVNLRIDLDEDGAIFLGDGLKIGKNSFYCFRVVPIQNGPAWNVENGKGTDAALEDLRRRDGLIVFLPNDPPRTPTILRFKFAPCPTLEKVWVRELGEGGVPFG